MILSKYFYIHFQILYNSIYFTILVYPCQVPKFVQHIYNLSFIFLQLSAVSYIGPTFITPAIDISLQLQCYLLSY